MLEKADLTARVPKEEYKSQISVLEQELGLLQRQAREAGLPVIIVFEGWDAAGKGLLINRLIQSLDPRGFQVYPTSKPNKEEKFRPFLWRFWKNIPARGRIAVFDRSWYGKVLYERVNKMASQTEWQSAYTEINDFEKTLTANGYLLIKLYLHISRKQQKKRFLAIENNQAEAWKVTADDWKQHKKYTDYVEAIEDMHQATHNTWAPWHLIETEHPRMGTLKMYKTVIQNIRQRLNGKRIPRIRYSYHIPKESRLAKTDLTLSLDREQYKAALKELQARVRELEHRIYQRRIPVVIAYEGWDAAGKGGNIQRLTSNMDPRGYDVIPIAAPSPIELAHHYQWRFWNEFPKAGHIAVFDRTWYGRVLVERIEGFAQEEEWQRAYQEINDMEKAWSSFGTVILKFWLHISPEEQLRRFEERREDPLKQWKITDEDWRNREKWGQYYQAVDEMLALCSPSYAPWTVIESNSKYYARIKVLRTVCDTLEKRLKD